MSNLAHSRTMRKRYTLPPRYRRKNKQDPAPHTYRMWRPCLLLLYFACFFYTPTAPNTGAPTPYYNTLLQSISFNSPHNTRYNSKWVLQCGDAHPNLAHRRIYQLRRDCRLVPGPPVPLLDIEEYAQHLVVNMNRQYDSLDNVTNEQDRDMKLAMWNIQGAQGTVRQQRWASVLHLVQQCRIDRCGIQEYKPGFPLPEAATTVINNEYKCYAARGNEPRVAFLVRNTVVPHVLETLYSPNGIAGALRLQLPNSPRRTIACVYSKFSRHDKQEVDLFLQARVKHFLLVLFGSDVVIVHRPEVTQVFHDVSASCGSKIRVCCDVQVFAG